MYFSKVSPTRISTDPGHGTRILRGRVFYSYFRMSTEHRSLLVVYVFNFYQTLQVVPHGTKGTGPGFVMRPVYLRSQFRNNTNTVSTLVLLIHLLQVLCTRYAWVTHITGRSRPQGEVGLTPRQYTEWNVAGRARSAGVPSQQGLLPEVNRTASTGGCAHLHDRRLTSQRTTNKEPKNKEPKTKGPVSGWYI